MPYDSLGRQVDATPDQIAKGMLRPVEHKPFNKGDGDKVYEKINAAMKDLSAMIDRATKFAREFSHSVVEHHKTYRGRGSSPAGKGPVDQRGMSKMLQDQAKDFGVNFKLLNKFANAGLHKGSIYNHDIHVERIQHKIVNQQSVMIQLLVNMTKAMNKIAGDTSDTKYIIESIDKHGQQSPRSVGLDELFSASREEQESTARRRQNEYRRRLFGQEDPVYQQQRWRDRFMVDFFRASHLATQGVSSNLMRRGDKSPMNSGLFGGMHSVIGGLEQSNQYQQNIAEVAYATESITADMKKQQAMFRANKEMTDIAVATGHEKLKVEEHYYKLLKSGFKTQKDTLKVSKTGAVLSTALGSGLEETTDFANELHMALGLSADSVSSIARGMKDTARDTKVSGSALIAAAQAAKPFLESMRNTGILNAAGAKGMISLQAGFQKAGVAQNFQDLFQGMTSPSAVMGAGMESQTLMAVMGGRQGLMPFMNGQMAGDLGKQREAWDNLSQYVGQVSGKTLAQLAKMGEDEFADFSKQNWQINLQVKGQLGKELGELRKGFEASNEVAKTFDMKMADINKKLVDAATTDEERVKLMKQQGDLQQSQRGDIAAKVASALSSTGSVEDAIKKITSTSDGKRLFSEGAAGGLFGGADVGTSGGMKEAIRNSMIDSFKMTNAALSKSTDRLDDKFIIANAEKKINEAIADGDAKGLEKLAKQLAEAQEAASGAEMADTDPARAASKGINSLNAAFDKYASDALMYLKLIAGSELIKNTGIFSLITRGLSGAGVTPEGIMKFGGALEGRLGGGKLKSVLSGVGSGLWEGLGLAGSRPGNFIAGKAGALKSGAGSLAGSIGATGAGVANWMNSGLIGRIASNPRLGLGEGLARFAQVQEQIPLWGKFASRFGAGNAVSSAAAGMAKSNPWLALSAKTSTNVFGKSTAAIAGMSRAGTLANIGTKAALPLLVFTSAMESVSQSLQAGAKAAEIFDVSEKNLTNSQVAAAENAGFLTGALNSLTFGILSPWIGVTGSITKSLAQFLDQFQLLNTALSIITIPFKAAYGVIVGTVKGLWEIVKGIGGAVWNILEPIGEIIGSVFGIFGRLAGVVGDLVSPLGLMFGQVKDGTHWVDLIIGGLTNVGKAIGWVIEKIGFLVSVPLRALSNGVSLTINVFMGLITVIEKALKPIIFIVAGAIGVLVDTFRLLWKGINWGVSFIGSIFDGLVGGIFAFWGEIGSGIMDGLRMAFEPFQEVWKELVLVFWDVMEPLTPIWEGFSELGGVLKDVMKEVFDFGGGTLSVGEILKSTLRLVGFAVGSVIRGFGFLVKILLGTVVPVIKTVIDVVGFLAKSLMYLGTGDIKGLGEHLFEGMKSALSNLPNFIMNVIGKGMVLLPNILMNGITSIGPTIVAAFTNVGSVVYNAIMGIFSGIGGAIGKIPGIGGLIPGGGLGGAIGAGMKAVVPGLATGGVVTQPGVIYAGENGPELVLPMDKFGIAGVQSLDGVFPKIMASMIGSMMPMGDVLGDVQRFSAAGRPTSVSVGGGDLSLIADLTAQQNEIMMEAVAELREIRASLSTGDRPMQPAGDPRSKRKELSSPNYYTLSFGGYGGNASKGYIQDGVS